MQWTKDWQIKFNNDTCKILHDGKNNPEFKYFNDGKELRCTEVEKHLGVFAEKDLKYEQHIYINKTFSMETKVGQHIVSNASYTARNSAL